MDCERSCEMTAAMLNLSLCLKISRLNTIVVAQFAYVTTTLRYTQYPPCHTLPLCNTLPSQHAILVQVLGQEMPGEMGGGESKMKSGYLHHQTPMRCFYWVTNSIHTKFEDSISLLFGDMLCR